MYTHCALSKSQLENLMTLANKRYYAIIMIVNEVNEAK